MFKNLIKASLFVGIGSTLCACGSNPTHDDMMYKAPPLNAPVVLTPEIESKRPPLANQNLNPTAAKPSVIETGLACISYELADIKCRGIIAGIETRPRAQEFYAACLKIEKYEQKRAKCSPSTAKISKPA